MRGKTHVVIREMKEEDFDPIVLLTEKHFPRAGGATLVRSRLAKGARYFIAQVEGNICGFVDLTLEGKARLYGLAVDEKYEGLGIGSMLTGKAIEEARKAGAQSISLVVKSENLRAIQLYRHKGFEVRKARRGISGVVLIMGIMLEA